MIWYIWCDIWYGIYVNCNLVATRWQQYSTHLHTTNTHNTQKDTKQTIHRKTQKYLHECRPCPVVASCTLAFALQLRERHGETSVRVAEECLPAGATSFSIVHIKCFHLRHTEWRNIFKNLSFTNYIGSNISRFSYWWIFLTFWRLNYFFFNFSTLCI